MNTIPLLATIMAMPKCQLRAPPWRRQRRPLTPSPRLRMDMESRPPRPSGEQVRQPERRQHRSLPSLAASLGCRSHGVWPGPCYTLASLAHSIPTHIIWNTHTHTHMHTLFFSSGSCFLKDEMVVEEGKEVRGGVIPNTCFCCVQGALMGLPRGVPMR